MSPQPGDIGFSRSNGAMGRLIRFGERLRLKRGSQWNHEFVVSDQVDVDGTPLIIQATLKGITDTARIDGVGEYVTMAPPDACDRHELLVFMKAQVGTRYGVGTILAIALDILTWDWFPAFRGSRKNSWICSAVTNEAMRFAGWYHPFVNIYTVTPQDGYDALNPN